MKSELNRISAPEAVFNYFKTQIETGVLRPGSQLPSERDLQKSLGISRFSLREGLARLQALGILTIRHGKGAFVAEQINQQSLEDVFTPLIARDDPASNRDLFEARNLLETQIAILACERARKRDLARLKSNLDAAEKAIDDPDNFGRLDYEFHREISVAAKNHLLQRMLEALTGHLKSFLLKHAQDMQSRKKALAQHKKIYKCLATKNTESIGHTVKQHIQGCRKNLESIK